jgi:hypothetical protein
VPVLDQFIIANSVSSNPDGTVDLFGASWDYIETASVPVGGKFSLLLSVLQTPEEARLEHTLMVEIFAPSGQPLARFSASVPMAPEAALDTLPEGDLARMETVLNASGFNYPEFGRYEIALLWDGEPLRAPMRFRIRQVSDGPSQEAG